MGGILIGQIDRHEWVENVLRDVVSLDEDIGVLILERSGVGRCG